jgi:hypothetical protein
VHLTQYNAQKVTLQGSIKLEMHYCFCKSNWYESQHANKSKQREKTEGLEGRGRKELDRMGTLGNMTPESRKLTEDADLPGPRCATMAPETALIQLCISSGLSAYRKKLISVNMSSKLPSTTINPMYLFL